MILSSPSCTEFFFDLCLVRRRRNKNSESINGRTEMHFTCKIPIEMVFLPFFPHCVCYHFLVNIFDRVVTS